ncbi:MAG: hypothetical protein AAF253_09360 [Pseudomonadota bacterium]
MATGNFARAKRRYHQSFWPLMAVYTVTIIGGSVWLGQYAVAPAGFAVAVALGATLPLIGILLVILRYFNETDEYTRLRQLNAFARAAVFTMSAVFLVGFLQLFDVIGRVEVFWFGPMFLASWGLAYCFGMVAGRTV